MKNENNENYEKIHQLLIKQKYILPIMRCLSSNKNVAFQCLVFMRNLIINAKQIIRKLKRIKFSFFTDSSGSEYKNDNEKTLQHIKDARVIIDEMSSVMEEVTGQ